MEILRTLVGSQAHGLATPESDWDYRGVFVAPTRDFFKLNGEKVKNTQWIEGDQDDTSYEIGHFLQLALTCSPNILEVFRAPVVSTFHSEYENELIGLFDSIWTASKVRDAFCGYSHNQLTKMLDDKLGTPGKFGVAYTRSLLLGIELLTEGAFDLRVKDYYRIVGQAGTMTWPAYLRAVKKGAVENGTIIQRAQYLKDTLRRLAKHGPYAYHAANPSKVQDFLNKVRKENW